MELKINSNGFQDTTFSPTFSPKIPSPTITKISGKIIPLFSESNPFDESAYSINNNFDYTGLEAIQHITTELLEGSEPLDPKYMKVINDNLADLLA